MLPIVTPEEMRVIDASAPEPLDVLVDRAGRRIARAARQMLGGVYGRRVTVVAGPGNNGADGLVAARLLERSGVRVAVVGPDERVLPPAHLVIDGAYGTGMNRDYAPAPTQSPVLAIDIPSGVDGLTGELHGQAPVAWKTVTFAALKPGLLLHPGAAHVGDIEVADIGLDVTSARAWLYTGHDAARSYPHRSPTDHKWNRAVLVVGGSPGMAGAPTLASEAALRSGAGLVRCVLPAGQIPAAPSAVVYSTTEASGWANEVIALASSGRFGALVIGPGLDEAVGADVRAVLGETTLPTVVDGTALRLLGDAPRLKPQVVLTPHDGEYRALVGAPPAADRFASVRQLAAATGATVLLKGPLTLIAAPDQRVLAVGHGDERLATAGSGDVLAGAIAAMLAAGVDPLTGSALGAWFHADAGRRLPTVGGTASDLVSRMPQSITSLVTPGGFRASN